MQIPWRRLVPVLVLAFMGLLVIPSLYTSDRLLAVFLPPNEGLSLALVFNLAILFLPLLVSSRRLPR